MAIPEEFLAQLKASCDIADVIGDYVQLKRAGRNQVGLCPFHNEKSPSFTVYTDTSSFYCFGCQTGGDVIGFIRRIENLDYVEAVKFLAARAGLQVPENARDSGLSKAKLRIREANRAAARFFHSQLYSPQGKQALAYFHDRELTDSTIRHFGLGYAPAQWDSLCRHLSSLGFADDEIESANLGFKNRYGKMTDRFRDRVMFPVIDLQGSVIAFGGRILNPEQKGGKYINTSDTLIFRKTDNLFALNFAKNTKGDTLILCEGYMDVIALHQAGFTNAVASLGTAFTKEQAHLLSKYAKKIILAQDGDAAGQEAIRRAISILKSTGMEIRVLMISGAKDPDEYIKKFGSGRFAKLLEEAVGDIDFSIGNVRAGHDLSSDTGRVNFLNEVCRSLVEVSPIELDIYASRIAAELGVDKNVIISQVNHNKRRRKRETERTAFREMATEMSGRDDNINAERRNNPAAARREDELLKILMRNPDYVAIAREKLPPEKMITSFNRRIYECILELSENGCELSLTSMGERFTQDELGAISRIINAGIGLRSSREELMQCIGQIIAIAEKPTAQQLAQASDDELRAQMERLRKKKNQGDK